MGELIKWFQLNYPELKEALIQCNHHFNEASLNPYHIEDDCWSHTMMVCKVAQIKNFDRAVQVAALLHDIAKPFTKTINSKKRLVYFSGHEEKSAQIAKPILEKMQKAKFINTEQIADIIEIIKLHGRIYKDKKSVLEELKNRPKVLQYLLELNTCDEMGRFFITN